MIATSINPLRTDDWHYFENTEESRVAREVLHQGDRRVVMKKGYGGWIR
jgi:hypothetical protein